MFAFTEEISKTNKAQITTTKTTLKADFPPTLTAFKNREVQSFLVLPQGATSLPPEFKGVPSNFLRVCDVIISKSEVII